MSLFRFEPKHAPLATRAKFAARLLINFAAAILMIGASLALGMAGYCATEHMSLLDAFLNASMLLGGMGPVDPLRTPAGKLFAGLYALYCGLVILAATAIILAPVFHRVLHRLHIADASD